MSLTPPVEKALFLGGPLHNDIQDVRTYPRFRAPLMDDRCLWIPHGVQSPHRIVDYSLYRYIFHQSHEVAIYSCVPDEQWMHEQLRGVHDRMWFIDSSEVIRRLVLSKELAKMHLNFEQDLMATEYAQETLRARHNMLTSLISRMLFGLSAIEILKHSHLS